MAIQVYTHPQMISWMGGDAVFLYITKRMSNIPVTPWFHYSQQKYKKTMNNEKSGTNWTSRGAHLNATAFLKE